jgi:hypothetical protein
MDDLKKGFREGEESAKEAWRNRDGEDLSDKVGNLGDDIRKNLGNLGDDARNAADDAGNRVDREADLDKDRF